MLPASTFEERGIRQEIMLTYHMSRRINFDSVVLVSAASSKEMSVTVMFQGI